MDKELEFKDNKVKYLADKIGTSYEQIIQEREQVEKIENLDKTGTVKNRWSSWKTQPIQLLKQLNNNQKTL